MTQLVSQSPLAVRRSLPLKTFSIGKMGWGKTLAWFAILLLATSPVVAQPSKKKKAAPNTYPALLAVGDHSQIPPVASDKLIGFALYTVQDHVLKLSAHLYPLNEGDAQTVQLDVRPPGGEWKQIAEADIHPIGWTALFRVEDWDDSKDMEYRVRHAGGSTYTGLIRRNPIDKETIVVAAFTGNSPGPGGGKISKQDIVDNVNKVDPDLLVFTGDQVYNHTRHTEHWLKFGKTFGDIMRNRPTLCLTDDHDVGQPNLWGQGGRKTDLDTKGGYTRPAEYVKLAERQQTSHMPDPYDPTPIDQGIGVYYTSLNLGGIDFAILEDRKFKSGCFDLKIVERGLGPRPDHIAADVKYDPKTFDLKGKQLLGERQEKFLDAWGRDWDGVAMKSVVSQTVFSMCSTRHGGQETPYAADFDAGGWPQTARNRAIRLMRKCGAFHICGDQHLGSITQYGVDQFRDGGFAFCVPSIANLWPRWWIRKDPPIHPIDSPLKQAGDYFDGFGNRITMIAYTNPRPSGRQPAALHDRMPGWGVIEFNKPQRTITMHCWPRMIDPTDPKSKEYTGWPRTIHQLDNLGKHDFWLPPIKVSGATAPRFQVIDDDSGEIVYTIRTGSNVWQPSVPQEGKYTVRVSENGKEGTVHVTATDSRNTTEVPVELTPAPKPSKATPTPQR